MRFPALTVLVWCVPLAALANNALVVQSDEARKLGVGDAVVNALTEAEVPLKVAGPKAPSIACTTVAAEAERRRCLADFATKSNVSTVVLVTAKKQGAAWDAVVELLAQSDGHELKRVAVKAPAAKWAKQAAPQLKALKAIILKQTFLAETPPATASTTPTPPPDPGAAKPTAPPEVKPEPPKPEAKGEMVITVKPKVKPQASPKRSDRPTDVALTPDPTIDMPLKVTAPSRSHAGAWAVTGVTVVAVAAAGAAGYFGLQNKGRLDASAPDGISTMPRSEALALQSQANTQLTGALVAGIVAVAAGTTSAILWGSDK